MTDETQVKSEDPKKVDDGSNDRAKAQADAAAKKAVADAVAAKAQAEADAKKVRADAEAKKAAAEAEATKAEADAELKKAEADADLKKAGITPPVATTLSRPTVATSMGTALPHATAAVVSFNPAYLPRAIPVSPPATSNQPSASKLPYILIGALAIAVAAVAHFVFHLF